MSRGPGVLQIRVMQTLKRYHELGAVLEWRWCNGGSWKRQYADPGAIADYERGGAVDLWILRRDLCVEPPLLSRAMRGLDRMGYIGLLDASLTSIHDHHYRYGEYAKFAYLTRKGEQFTNLSAFTKLSLKAGNAP